MRIALAQITSTVDVEENAATVKVEIDFKPEYAISSVRYQPIPGWTAEVTKTPLPAPVKKLLLDLAQPNLFG